MPSLPVSSRIVWCWHLLLLVPSWIFPAHSSVLLLHHSQFFHHAAMNPITQLTLNLEQMSQNSEGTPTKYLVKQSLASVKHLQSLIQLTQVSHQKISFSIKPALREVLIRNHQVQRGHYLLEVFNFKSDPSLYGNPFYFQEALDCLIHNAFEAYPRTEKSKVVHLVSHVQNGHLLIQICDYGQGMNWMTSKFALKIGFSHKPDSEAHGRGLAFVKQVIETHFRGQFALNSQAGIGTVAMIKLPISSRNT